MRGRATSTARLAAAALVGASLATCAAARPAAAAARPAGSVSVLDHGAKGDGVTDDTAALRRAAATGRPLWFPTPAAYYRITGTIELRNSIYGQRRPELRMDPGVQDGGADNDTANGTVMLLVRSYQGPGMVIDSIHLNGSWNHVPLGRYDAGQPAAPQWSHGIRIMGPSRNVTVRNCWIENNGGDNIAITWYRPEAGPPRNIEIVGNKLQWPWRCNVFFNAGAGVVIQGNYCEDLLDGSAQGYPGNFQGLIQIETDYDYHTVAGVTIRDNVLNASRSWGGMGAVTLSNVHAGATGGVTVSGNRGVWSEVAPSIAWPGDAAGLVGRAGTWTASTVSGNSRDRGAAWSFAP
ncbi:glycosyl hydrolase family 28-related protein [Anaeromyxobacter diazotrophicus]|uniref:Pectate lyase superfamily protein domain-containing protein n=1 Tax=Anaeromyxobacter diazotrophicus TaxID=2590199 RepID=A0A7I9VP28_9BACT|nr:glycosyl hydrolase family 28-related protein [Anaeromyxobacter diazotrophicus]GEJ58164.1 hypothetical protein AMYX_29050 [Anaeromyxobacter diazotrophicus]